MLYIKRTLFERTAFHTGSPSSRSSGTPTATAGSPPRSQEYGFVDRVIRSAVEVPPPASCHDQPKGA